jgi:hypothetical protein
LAAQDRPQNLGLDVGLPHSSQFLMRSRQSTGTSRRGHAARGRPRDCVPIVRRAMRSSGEASPEAGPCNVEGQSGAMPRPAVRPGARWPAGAPYRSWLAAASLSRPWRLPMPPYPGPRGVSFSRARGSKVTRA